MAERTDTVRKIVPLRTRIPTQVVRAVLGALCWCALPAQGDPLPNDYPTSARVEFVQDCIGRHGGKLEDLYKCSCVIDRLAAKLTYDDYVEAATFAHYSTLPGEGGGIFRDPDTAKQKAKLYRTIEAEAYKACGLGPAIK
ncbi:MAG TPA: hypothetical protein VNO35_28375 [Steroidobacteraceae bacterium]|nr:hypothetical protein [Steroidobacteraceae bacterium]